MARMKTGRLTPTTTKELSNQAEWDKYDQDYKSYKNYDSDVKSYSEKKKKYDEEMKGASGGYDYLKFGGKSNTRRLNPTELAEFNKGKDLEQEWVDIPKSYKGKVSDVNAYMGKSKKPTAPVKREQPKVPEILDKMPIPKAQLIKTKKTGIKTREEAPAPEKFVNPGKPVRRGESVSMNPLAKGATTKGAGKRYVKQVIGSIGKTGDNSRGYKREEKQFKAYAGQTATGDSFLDMTPKDIKAYRNEAKSIRADYRKQPDSDTRSMGKAAMTSEIRQSRKAEKFSKKVYDFKDKGGVKFFNDKNYGGNIIKDYRASEDNANNRNNMANKLKAIGDKTSKRRAELEKSKTGGFQYNQVNQ